MQQHKLHSWIKAHFPGCFCQTLHFYSVVVSTYIYYFFHFLILIIPVLLLTMNKTLAAPLYSLDYYFFSSPPPSFFWLLYKLYGTLNLKFNFGFHLNAVMKWNYFSHLCLSTGNAAAAAAAAEWAMTL